MKYFSDESGRERDPEHDGFYSHCERRRKVSGLPSRGPADRKCYLVRRLALLFSVILLNLAISSDLKLEALSCIIPRTKYDVTRRGQHGGRVEAVHNV